MFNTWDEPISLGGPTEYDVLQMRELEKFFVLLQVDSSFSWCITIRILLYLIIFRLCEVFG